jgi:hypothetical protein
MQSGYQGGLARANWSCDHDQANQLSSLQLCCGKIIQLIPTRQIDDIRRCHGRRGH